jgi:hypothetical protein
MRELAIYGPSWELTRAAIEASELGEFKERQVLDGCIVKLLVIG